MACVLICFVFLTRASQPYVNSDSLVKIIKIDDKKSRERRLAAYIVHCFQAVPVDQLDSAKNKLNNFLADNKVENSVAFGYFIEGSYQQRLANLDKAEVAIIAAIDAISKSTDHYLMFRFLSHLALLQTDKGNIIGAVSSYRTAKKEAIKLNEPYLQVVIDINISDAYYRNNFYNLSLFYLDQAKDICAKNQIKEPRIVNVINYNKAENFFRMKKADSLKLYGNMLKRATGEKRRLHTYIKRVEYYQYLLGNDYKRAINFISALQTDSLFRFNDLDRQNLSEACFKGGQPDSAKAIIDRLLSGRTLDNHPEIKFKLYNMLGEIARGKNDHKAAAENFKLALQQSEDNNNRLAQVGNISALMKIDEVEGTYLLKDQIYRTERTWLIFMIIVALLTVGVVMMFYRNIRQKRHYEQLLFTAKRKELAFINSHDVRKHLSNILGIIEVIKNSENKERDYLQAEEHLFCSAEMLDEAIVNISEKLNDD